MKTIDLMQWCDPNGAHPTAKRPYALGGRDYATNIAIAVSVPAIGEHAAPEDDATKRNIERMKRWMEEPREFVPLPTVTMPEKIVCTTCCGVGTGALAKCPECEGAGSVYLSTSHNDYEFDCKSCDGEGSAFKPEGDTACDACLGTGHTYRWGPVAIAGMHVASRYLRLIIDIPGVMISADPEKHQLHFKAGDARGIIMGMRV